MRNHKKIPVCKKTGKATYSSEAKAIRAVNNYEEIKRAYFCSHCDGFHITSQTVEETLDNGGNIDTEEENRLLKIKINKMANNIDELKKRVSQITGSKENWRHKHGRKVVFIKYHEEIPEHVKEEFKNLE